MCFVHEADVRKFVSLLATAPQYPFANEALSQSLQARLLTFINEQGTPAETRIVAICNDHEQGRTVEDALRPDLYYRLGAMKITLPPLRSRGEDILTLFTRMAEQFIYIEVASGVEVQIQRSAVVQVLPKGTAK